MRPKFDTCVAVFIKKDNALITRFVTSLDNKTNTARWEDGKPAMFLGESYAKDVVYGLTLNGYAAAVVRVPHGVELSN